MNGFLKRDWALFSVNARFYLIFIAFFGALALFTDFSFSFISLYLVIFSATSITSLFNYDELTRWDAYAAAAPRGRQAMVDARYIFCVLIGGAVFVLQLVLGVVSHDGQLETAFLYGLLFFLYAAITLPLFYHFGGLRARVAMICVMAVLAALIVAGGTLATLSAGGPNFAQLWGFLPVLFPLVAAVLFVLSWLLSRRIMAKKEL